MIETTVARALSRVDLEPAGLNAYPRRPAPMLLRRAEKIVSAPEWTYESKWDGFRVLAAVRNGAVRLISRNGHSFTAVFGPISDTLRNFPVSIVLDGEVIVITDKGHPDFQALQARLRPRNGKLAGHLCYMIFDCLYVNGYSLLGRPLEARQAVLWELQHALQTDEVKLTEGFSASKSARLMAACAHMGLEGVVMKRKGSLYRPGVRSTDWLKVPIRHREEFVIAGYLPSRRGFTTLILGQYAGNGRLTYAGFCGTGLSDETRAVIFEELRATHRTTCPFGRIPILRDEFRELPDTRPQWVRPAVVVEVEYRQRVADGLRHAVLKGVRPDRTSRSVRRSALAERGSF